MKYSTITTVITLTELQLLPVCVIFEKVMKMKIGIDARAIAKQRTGIGVYLFNILRYINEIDESNEFFLYSNSDFELPFNNLRWHKRIGSGLAAKSGTVWLLGFGNKIILQDHLDVFWGAQQVLPNGLNVRKIITVCDLVWHYYPQTMSRYNLIVHKLFATRSILNANAILCISETTANDLRKIVPNNAPIFVTHCAINENYKPYNPIESRKYISNRYRCSENYILTVGTIEPRKNILSLMKAYKVLKDKYNVIHKLVIAGARGWNNSSFNKDYEKIGFKTDEVIFLGYVPEEDMPKLYSGAEIFVFPSIYEGFGIPLLEAMACGCPVIVSNMSSMPEVIGEAGILVNPNDINEFVKIMHKVLIDSQIKTGLRILGIERAKLFSWKNSARKTLEVLTNNI